MTAGSGIVRILVVDGTKEADLLTAIQIHKATAAAWEAIAIARAQTIHHLQLALDRYQKRGPN